MAALLETTCGVPAAPPRTSRAFGLALELGFDVPGLPVPSVDGLLPARRVRVEMAEPGSERRWHAESGEVLLRQRLPGWPGTMVLEHRGDELLLCTPDGADYLLRSDGTRVLCAPPPAGTQWQRFLIGQVLPLASVLHGLEVLHASAVVYQETAIAFCGHSGAGKTSLAASLVQRGATILTDDVLAVEPVDDVVMAHPGPRVLNLPDRPGVPLADHARPVPLGALCVIERKPAGTLEIAPVPATAPMLLATTFNFAVRSHERMASQFDLHARLARSAAMFRARVPPQVDAQALGVLLEAHVVRALAAR